MYIKLMRNDERSVFLSVIAQLPYYKRLLEKSFGEAHDVFPKKVNQIVRSANDDKRIQTPGEVISYPYGTGLGRVCKAEMMTNLKIKN